MTVTRAAPIALAVALGAHATGDEYLEFQRKAERQQVAETRAQDARDDQHHEDEEPYLVEVGVYGITEPSVFPEESWIQIGCFSEPGRSYVGFSLMYVDMRVHHQNGVWDTRDDDKDRGICDINQGIDTTFVAIPRNLQVRSYSVFVTAQEQADHNVG